MATNTPLGELNTRGAKPPTHESGWENIDGLLDNAVKEMALGQMVHKEDFSLYQSMSAVELMDPKMDHGMNPQTVVPVQDRLTAGEVKLQLSATETLDILDTLFTQEAAHYYKGYSTAQTLYTCYYCHKCVLAKLQEQFICSPSKQNKGVGEQTTNADDAAVAAETLMQLQISSGEQLEGLHGTIARVLYTYVVATLKTADLIHTKIKTADIYEDDDFYPRTFGLYLCSDVDEAIVEDLVKSAEIQARKYGSNGTEKDTVCKEDQKVWDSIAARLAFRLSFWRSQQIAADVEVLCQDRENMKRALSLFQAAEEAFNGINAKSTESAVVPCIDTLLAAEIMPNMPSMKLDVPTFGRAREMFSKSLKDFVFVVTRTLDIPTTFMHAKALELYYQQDNREILDDSVLDPLVHIDIFLDHFAEQDADIVVRSYLWSTFRNKQNCLGLGGLPLIVRASTKAFGVPSWMHDSEEGMEVVSLISNSLQYVFRTRCLTPARQHRRLMKNLADWGNLQRHGDIGDEELLKSKNIPIENAMLYINRFGSWILDRSLRMMKTQLCLGIQCNLYSFAESMAVVWYVENLLRTTTQNLRASMNRYLESPHVPPLSTGEENTTPIAGEGMTKRQKKRDKKKKKKKQANAMKNDPLPPTPGHIFHMFTLEATKAAFSGLFIGLLGLREKGFGGMEQFRFGDEKFRFEGRFKHFYTYDQYPPVAFTYGEYKKTLQAEGERGPDGLIDFAGKILKSSGQSWKKSSTIVGSKSISENMKVWLMKEKKWVVMNVVSLTRISGEPLEKEDGASSKKKTFLNTKGIFERS
jgi:hypothetical protein